ncbi:GNAT family N-acetyltransferase [Paenibacillus sp. GCM10012307]|uniref:GNAT family N-acetyltransferase n=1 Tax=Paenibacillus roseus TaxID=2798579 RepID=A0A934J6B8_9BACL|nr:GNAT family N-acetyltransferase [Paenibacillus roseus]MBJ6363690.1 GNAT family N-acetyltransferase [Paenibacillus roseus]
MRIVYRPIRKHELQQAYQLESASYPAEAAATLEAFHYRQERFPDYFWSAWDEENGALAGIANGIRTSALDCSDEEMKGAHQDDESGMRFCVLTVAVDASYQRLGIGRELMIRLIQTCRQEGLEAIILMCEQHLIAFYEQLGFAYRGESSSQHGGIKWHELSLDLAWRQAAKAYNEPS